MSLLLKKNMFMLAAPLASLAEEIVVVDGDVVGAGGR